MPPMQAARRRCRAARRIATAMNSATAPTSAPSVTSPRSNDGRMTWSVAQPSTRASATVMKPNSTLPTTDTQNRNRLLLDAASEQAEAAPGDVGRCARAAEGVEAGRSADTCPAARKVSFTCPMVMSPKWKTLAASTASAPASTAGGKCSSRPAPPLAMSGTCVTSRTARIISRSKPSRVPSASIELSRISPAPSSVARRAHSTASMPAERAAAVGGHLEAAGLVVLRVGRRR